MRAVLFTRLPLTNNPTERSIKGRSGSFVTVFVAVGIVFVGVAKGSVSCSVLSVDTLVEIKVAGALVVVKSVVRCFDLLATDRCTMGATVALKK